MTAIKFDKMQDTITARLTAMMKNSSNLQGYLNRVVYPQYQQFQIQRWESENVSEGGRWKSLNADYSKRKLRKYASYPYSGTRILIATGTLFKSVVGSDSTYHRKIVDNRSLTVQTTLEYAPYVAEARPFMNFGRASLSIMKRGIRDFIRGRE